MGCEALSSIRGSWILWIWKSILQWRFIEFGFVQFVTFWFVCMKYIRTFLRTWGACLWQTKEMRDSPPFGIFKIQYSLWSLSFPKDIICLLHLLIYIDRTNQYMDQYRHMQIHVCPPTTTVWEVFVFVLLVWLVVCCVLRIVLCVRCCVSCVECCVLQIACGCRNRC